jgi:hypothetical protein
VKLSIQNGDHLSRNAFIFDVRVAIRKAPPLFPELVSSHLDFTSTLNKFL